jgi:hypothetical protein
MIGITLRKSVNLTRMVQNPITKKRSKVASKLDLSGVGSAGQQARADRR